jgi:hypothetical protein
MRESKRVTCKVDYETTRCHNTKGHNVPICVAPLNIARDHCISLRVISFSNRMPKDRFSLIRIDHYISSRAQHAQNHDSWPTAALKHRLSALSVKYMQQKTVRNKNKVVCTSYLQHNIIKYPTVMCYLNLFDIHSCYPTTLYEL